jgi:hypothetical protein
LANYSRKRKDEHLLYRLEEPIKPTKEEPLSFVLFESPFASVSTDSRGNPTLFSLGKTQVVYTYAIGPKGKLKRKI